MTVPIPKHRSIVVSVDPSSKKLSACASDVKGTFLTMDTRRLASDPITRLGQAHQWMRDVILGTGVAPERICVVVESPIVWGSKQSTLVLGQISGSLLSAAALCDVAKIMTVNPSTWKKVVVGNGGAKKPEIARHVHEHWPNAWDRAKKDGDLLDAACINRYGAAIVTRAERIKTRAEKPIPKRTIRRIR